MYAFLEKKAPWDLRVNLDKEAKGVSMAATAKEKFNGVSIRDITEEGLKIQVLTIILSFHRLIFLIIDKPPWVL